MSAAPQSRATGRTGATVRSDSAAARSLNQERKSARACRLHAAFRRASTYRQRDQTGRENYSRS